MKPHPRDAARDRVIRWALEAAAAQHALTTDKRAGRWNRITEAEQKLDLVILAASQAILNDVPGPASAAPPPPPGHAAAGPRAGDPERRHHG